MARAVQSRTLKTRARLIAAAEELISQHGYEALRVEEVVLRAGVAKGTFFAHFRDKDALMDLLMGNAMDDILANLEAAPAPRDAADMAKRLSPLIKFMTAERYIFDVIVRYSGAAGVEEVGPIAQTFGRQDALFRRWVSAPGTGYRTDIDPDLLAEGVQAFLIQAIALKFCALHASLRVEDRLGPYLQAWLR